MLNTKKTVLLAITSTLLAACGGGGGSSSSSTPTPAPDVDKFAAERAVFDGGEYMLGMSLVNWEGSGELGTALAAILNSDDVIDADFARFATKLTAQKSTDVTRKDTVSEDFAGKITLADCQASGDFTFEHSQTITTSGADYSIDSITFCVDVNGETEGHTSGDAVVIDSVWATAEVTTIANGATETVTVEASNGTVTSDGTAYSPDDFTRTGVAKKMGGAIYEGVTYPDENSIDFCSSSVLNADAVGVFPSSTGDYIRMLCNTSNKDLMDMYSLVGLTKTATDSSTGVQYLSVDYHEMAGGNIGEVPKASNEITTYYMNDIELTADDGRTITLEKVKRTMNGSAATDTVNEVELTFTMVFNLTDQEILDGTPAYDPVSVKIDPADDSI